MRKRESDPQVLVLRTGLCSSMLEEVLLINLI